MPSATLGRIRPALETVTIPRPDPLVHGPAYFRAVERGGFQDGQLNGLRAYN
jgi:hypothetical protein